MRILWILLLTLGTLQAVSIDMQESYSVALEKAKNEDKPLLVYLYMLNCNTCKYMDNEAFRDEKVIDYLNKNYVVVKLYTNNRGLPKELRVEMAPVFHFIDSQSGEMLESIIGGRDPHRFLKQLQNSFADYREEQE